MKKLLKVVAPVLFSFFIIWFFWHTRISAVKLYPVVINCLFFCVFFASCFAKETVIQKIAKVTDGVLTPQVADYTRKLTYVWVVFLFGNFIISLISLFFSDKFWMLYNGCISYCLVGLLFAVEYIVRYFFKKRHNL